MRVDLRHILAAIISGLLLAAAFPKWDYNYLLVVALVPLLWAIRGKSRKAAFWLGLLSGLAFYAGLLYWIIYVTYVFGHLPLPIAIGVLLLLAGYLSLYRAFWALGVNWGESRGLNLLWWAPVLWVALEFGQTYIISGFPWELLGTGLYRFSIFLQVADLTGVYGLSFLLVLINAAIFLLLSPARSRETRRLAYLPIVLLVLAAWVGYGFYRLGVIEKLSAASTPLKVAVVQGDIKQGDKWKKDMVQATLDRYKKLTLRVKGAKLIVWPESAAPFFFLRSPNFTAQVQEIAKAAGGYLLFGAPAMELAAKGEKYFNRAYLLSPEGNVEGYYDKAHLVPYGEYVPLKRFFPFLGKMVLMVGDFTPGKVGGVVTIPEGDVGPLICFESIFPYLARAQVKNGAHLLVNLTNDAWYGTTSAPYQSLAMAVLRCVENHVCMARAANTGISAFIGGDGRILWRSDLFVPTSQALNLPWLPGGSPYTKYGDVFAWGCVIIAGLELIISRRRR